MSRSLDELAGIFRKFSQVESQQMSPFYSAITLGLSTDPQLLAVASKTREGQPPPNMLLAAVRFLLDRGAAPDLLALYPSGAQQQVVADPYPLFRQFVIEHEPEITSILQSRSVQSNVVRRSAVLVLGLATVAESLGGEPFAQIEIGASLGLTLLWNRFSYIYSNGLHLGPSDSQVHITSRLTGNPPFSASAELPRTLSNTGIELSPVSLDDQDAIAWLEALIWPEHEDNRALWRAAVSLARKHPPRVLAGDANDLLPNLFTELPATAPACVYHSHTLNQFSPEAKQLLESLLCQESTRRPVFRLSFEGEGTHSALRLFKYVHGTPLAESHLADCEAHGRWIDWS